MRSCACFAFPGCRRFERARIWPRASWLPREKRDCPSQQATFSSLRRKLLDRKSTRLNSSHTVISYAVFCLKKKNEKQNQHQKQTRGHARTGVDDAVAGTESPL